MEPLPADLLAAVAAAVAELPGRRLAAAAQALSGRYRGPHPGVGGSDEAVAYAAVRLPATYAAVRAALRALAVAVPGWTPRTVLDLGAGTGSAAWAAVTAYPAVAAVTAVERDPRLADLATRLAASRPVLAATRRIAGDLATTPLPPADLVVASYALGELPAERRSAAVAAAWRATTGVLLVVEPGTPVGTAVVLAAREQAVGAGATVAAPCPHDRECPMRAPAWCHTAVRLPRSSAHRAAKGAELAWEDEKFAYVAAARFAVPPRAARVVGRPRRRSRLVELPLCTTEGLESRVVTPRAGADSYRQARGATWGADWPT